MIRSCAPGLGACFRELSAAWEPDLACAFVEGAPPGYCLLLGLEKQEVAYWGKVRVEKMAGQRNGLFIRTLPSDFIMVKFIKVVTSLKSHQEKQIWTC